MPDLCVSVFVCVFAVLVMVCAVLAVGRALEV